MTGVFDTLTSGVSLLYQKKMDYLRDHSPGSLRLSDENILLMEIDRLQNILVFINSRSRQETIRNDAKNGLSY